MINDSDELKLVYKAFALAASGASGFVTGYVEWSDDKAARVAREKLADLNGLTPEGIRCEAIDFVKAGGVIFQVRETRMDRPDYAYYYKIILPFDFVPRGVFVEMRLADDDKDDPVVHIVSSHRQGV